jgi:hypothetical protein
MTTGDDMLCLLYERERVRKGKYILEQKKKHFAVKNHFSKKQQQLPHHHHLVLDEQWGKV